MGQYSTSPPSPERGVIDFRNRLLVHLAKQIRMNAVEAQFDTGVTYSGAVAKHPSLVRKHPERSAFRCALGSEPRRRVRTMPSLAKEAQHSPHYSTRFRSRTFRMLYRVR